jgi:hypothetical protein
MELYTIGIIIWILLGVIAFIRLIQTIEYNISEKVVLFFGSIIVGPILFFLVFGFFLLERRKNSR